MTGAVIGSKRLGSSSLLARSAMIASNSLRSTLAPLLPRARNLSKIRIRFLRLADGLKDRSKMLRLIVLDQTPRWVAVLFALRQRRPFCERLLQLIEPS